ncbi:MAG: sensor histidine kinase [Parafilimonas sp.]
MKKCSGIFVLLIALHLAGFSRNINPVQNGVLNITRHNWQKDGIVNVSGNWEFYWDKLYFPDSFKDTSLLKNRRFASVPDFWNKYITTKEFSHHGFGYATYHVKILCPPLSEKLALKLFTVQGAYKIFVNGKLISQMGNPGTTEAGNIADLKPSIVNVQPENNVLDIVIQVSNFENRVGGIWDNIEIGTRSQIDAKTIKNLAIAFIVAGTFLLAFIYNLIQFIHFRNRYALLFFSMLCLIIFVRMLVTDEIPLNYLFNCNWEFIRRMEFISFYFSVPVMSLFSYYLFPEDFSKKALYIIIPATSFFILISIFGSYYNYTYFVRYYEFIMMASAFYGLYVYIRAAVKNRPGSYLFLTGFILFLATIINDVLYVNLIINTVPLFYAGLASFVLILSVILSRQFVQTFSDLEVVNKQLAEANASLSFMNTDIQKKNAELKKINHELDSFVHRTSHDLRAPLSSVTGITHLMENEKNISVLRDYTSLQQKTLQRMDDLIKDIIDFSKNKRLQLTLDEINFSEVVSNCVEDHRYLKNASDVHLEVEVHQHEKFISDFRRVSTVVNNLVSNAIKYADLSKPKPYIIINIMVAANNAHVEISDNGIGIEEDKLGKIFTMFYRATSSSTGSGLGLYLVKETVEKLGGYISIDSKKGEGTTIKIDIPDKCYELPK